MLEPFVTTPADHFPHSVLILCPKQWQILMKKTFLQPEVFSLCLQPAEIIKENFRQYFPEWLRQEYKWDFDFAVPLPTAYILPKPTRDFQKARPIVNYSRSWILSLGTALAIELLEIAKTVFPNLFLHDDVSKILIAVQTIFSQTHADEELTLLQQDIAGFYNQVSHQRIIDSVQYTVFKFVELQNCPIDQVIQASMKKQERTLRVFHGQWRSRARTYQGPRTSMFAGLLARARLVIRHTFPDNMCLAQLQDLIALHVSVDPVYLQCFSEYLQLCRTRFPRVMRSFLLRFVSEDLCSKHL